MYSSALSPISAEMPRHHLMACAVVTSKPAGIVVFSMRLRFATLEAASPEEDARLTFFWIG